MLQESVPIPEYDADEAVKSATRAVSKIGLKLDSLKFTSKHREKQYREDINSIQAYDRYERVVIAICGATGAGKSSLINAILDNEIVPTSSAAACTSVVTRIQFSPTGKHRAEVHFLTREEWTKELTALVADVADSQFGNDDSEHATGFLGEVAKPAWDKFHAVYPDIPIRALDKLEIEDLLLQYPAVTKLLDQTLPILSETPEELSAQVRDYLESRKDLRGKIAYWPLIRHVDIFCPADALETGAVLVDLPGVADCNSARNAIAQKFIEQSHHFWIVVPVQRAMDDRTALELLDKAWRTQLRLDGSLNPESITYIATKCDGIRVSEIVKSLGLSEHSKYQRLWKVVARRAEKLKDAEKACSEMVNTIEDTKKSLDTKKTRLAELQKLLQATSVEGAANPSQPDRTGLSQESSSALKRKGSTLTSNTKGGATRNKRARVAISQAESQMPAVVRSRADVEEEIAALDAEIIREDSLSLRQYRLLIEAQDTREEARMAHSQSQKKLVTYCHVARSEILEKDIQSGFRADTAEHAQSEMDLPVFAVSSREYMRQTDQISDEPLEFTSVDDTGIPALQEWCHALTLPVREADARKAMEELAAFAVTLRTYVAGAPEVAEEERKSLRAQWESTMFWGSWGDEEYVKEGVLLSVSEYLWKQRGIVWRLIKAFHKLTEERRRDLEGYFTEYLDERCKEGAKLAAESAYAASLTFARSRHWQTYRAVLRRGGEYGAAHDLNAELTVPLAVHIASSWRDLFTANLFGKVEEDVTQTIDDLVEEFVQGVPEYLRVRAQEQADSCRQEARAALSSIMTVVGCELNAQQKKISRGIAPHVQCALLQAYEEAILETGPGSVARQQKIVHDYVHQKRGDLFGDAASILMQRLDAAASGIACSLRLALQKIARKAETNLAVLWEKAFDNDEDGSARKELLALLDTVLSDLDALERARELRDAEPRADQERQDKDDALEDEDATANGDSGGEQVERRTGSHDDDSMPGNEAVVDAETGGAVRDDANGIADAQEKPALATEAVDVVMDIAPARPEDGETCAIKVEAPEMEAKIEDTVEDGDNGGQKD